MTRASSWLLAGLLGVGGLLAADTPAQAQRGGFGRGGYGGFSSGGMGRSYGGFGLGIGNYGNYGYGNYGGIGNYGGYGLNRYGGYGLGNYGYGSGYYNPGYYGGTGYYSGYGPNYYSGGTYGAPSYDYAAPPVDYGAAQPQPQQAVPQNRAQIHVILPDPEAQVWFDGRKTNATGPTRDFTTPDLDPGADYHYTITAALRQQDGRVVTQERQVNVRAGRDVVVDFTRSTGGSTGASGSVPTGNVPQGNFAPERRDVPPGVNNTPRGVNTPGTRNNVPDDGRVPGTPPAPRNNTPGSRNVPGGNNNNPGGNVDQGVRGTANPSDNPR